jgi:hypothetical protein
MMMLVHAGTRQLGSLTGAVLLVADAVYVALAAQGPSAVIC